MKGNRVMRRFSILIALMLVFGVFSASIMAQEDQPAPPVETDDPALRAEEAALRAEEILAEAEAVLEETRIIKEEAGNAFETASSMFGLFEAMSGAVGLVVPFLAVVAGLLGLGRLENAQNELRKAREQFEEDIRLKEGQLDKLREELQASAAEQREIAGKASLALALLPLGERQYRAQDYKGALDTYERALRLDPNNPIIHYRMGYVFTQSGELERAEYHFTTSLELDPEFSPSRVARGYVYRRMGDKLQSDNIERDIMYNKAEENFLHGLREATKLIDEDGESWWGALGGLYRRRGQISQAIMAYRRGAEVTPHSSYPFSNLALLYMQTRDRDQMLDTYKRVEQLAWNEVQADVDNYWAYADLIVSRLALGKVKQTEDILETALSTAPVDSPYALESLLETLQRLAEVVDPRDRAPIEHVVSYIEGFRERQKRQQRILE